MSLSVEDLRSFAYVAEERSASRAAVRLGLTQQSVSERIMRLERRLGVALFRRLPHGMRPTSAGYRLLPYAHRTLALVDQAMDAVQGNEVVRVLVQSSIAPGVEPLLEEALSELDVELSRADSPDEILDAVREGGFDLAVGAFDATGQSEEIPAGDVWEVAVVVERAFDDPVVCVATPDHPLSHESSLRLSQLGAAGLGLGTAASAAAPGDVESREGPRVALCTRSTVAEEIALGRLVELPVVDLPIWVVPVHLAYRATDAERQFLDVVRRASLYGSSEQAASDRRRVGLDVA